MAGTMSDKRDEREWITTFAKTPSELYAKHREMLEVIKSQAAELAAAWDVIVAARPVLEIAENEYGPDHPDVKCLVAALAALDANIGET